MRRWLRWLPFAVAAADALLAATDAIDLRTAAIALLAAEAVLAALVLTTIGPPPIVSAVVRLELRLYHALFDAVRGRRPRAAIAYGGRLRGLLVGMTAVSVVELFVVEVVVPWPAARWALLILGAYGLLWVAAFLAATVSRPHTVTDDAVRLRFAVFHDIEVPLRHLEDARRALRGSHRRTVEVDGEELSVSVLGTTNVLLLLSEPSEVDLGRPGRHRISRIRLYADDPPHALELLRRTKI
ncbi:hypothetical protein [Dactylosporangium sp. NPDC048998]|uniref:hypothetical protein n=1 Tax=Dactylosporangium sp. NPDC048998 TaxID=3363976 RepID=UPI0037216D50